jgi:predicted amidohydrolase
MQNNQPASGNYLKVPLRKDTVNVGIIQSIVESVDIANPELGKKEHLQHMLDLIDLTLSFGQKDLLVFHEFPLAAMSFSWNREQALRVAIDVPGPETEAIGARAKKNNCYIHFGCYGKLKEWPNHFMNLGLIVGPSGELVYTHWKTRNMSGMGFSTTVYDVLDRYVEMYGWDAVFPVARTDIGNLCTIPETLEPEMNRVYSMKGAEMVIRYMTAGAGTCQVWPSINYLGGQSDHTFRNEFQGSCISGGYWGLFVNNSLSKMGKSVFDLGAGHSAIFDYNGRMLIEASTSEETFIGYPIPMGDYRKTHDIPNFPKELYLNFYQQYVPKFPANQFAGWLPDSIMDAVKKGKGLARW